MHTQSPKNDKIDKIDRIDRIDSQYVSLASALEIIGGRWTLLIVLELLVGPRRFKDLLDGLPGISTSLLAQRLKSLEQQGIIRRRILPPPMGSSVYELTEVGRTLEPVVLELTQWGCHLLPTELKIELTTVK